MRDEWCCLLLLLFVGGVLGEGPVGDPPLDDVAPTYPFGRLEVNDNAIRDYLELTWYPLQNYMIGQELCFCTRQKGCHHFDKDYLFKMQGNYITGFDYVPGTYSTEILSDRIRLYLEIKTTISTQFCEVKLWTVSLWLCLGEHEFCDGPTYEIVYFKATLDIIIVSDPYLQIQDTSSLTINIEDQSVKRAHIYGCDHYPPGDFMSDMYSDYVEQLQTLINLHIQENYPEYISSLSAAHSFQLTPEVWCDVWLEDIVYTPGQNIMCDAKGRAYLIEEDGSPSYAPANLPDTVQNYPPTTDLPSQPYAAAQVSANVATLGLWVSSEIYPDTVSANFTFLDAYFTATVKFVCPSLIVEDDENVWLHIQNGTLSVYCGSDPESPDNMCFFGRYDDLYIQGQIITTPFPNPTTYISLTDHFMHHVVNYHVIYPPLPVPGFVVNSFLQAGVLKLVEDFNDYSESNPVAMPSVLQWIFNYQMTWSQTSDSFPGHFLIISNNNTHKNATGPHPDIGGGDIFDRTTAREQRRKRDKLRGGVRVELGDYEWVKKEVTVEGKVGEMGSWFEEEREQSERSRMEEENSQGRIAEENEREEQERKRRREQEQALYHYQHQTAHKMYQNLPARNQGWFEVFMSSYLSDPNTKTDSHTRQYLPTPVPPPPVPPPSPPPAHTAPPRDWMGDVLIVFTTFFVLFGLGFYFFFGPYHRFLSPSRSLQGCFIQILASILCVSSLVPLFFQTLPTTSCVGCPDANWFNTLVNVEFTRAQLSYELYYQSTSLPSVLNGNLEATAGLSIILAIIFLVNGGLTSWWIMTKSRRIEFWASWVRFMSCFGILGLAGVGMFLASYLSIPQNIIPPHFSDLDQSEKNPWRSSAALTTAIYLQEDLRFFIAAGYGMLCGLFAACTFAVFLKNVSEYFATFVVRSDDPKNRVAGLRLLAPKNRPERIEGAPPPPRPPRSRGPTLRILGEEEWDIIQHRAIGSCVIAFITLFGPLRSSTVPLFQRASMNDPSLDYIMNLIYFVWVSGLILCLMITGCFRLTLLSFLGPFSMLVLWCVTFIMTMSMISQGKESSDLSGVVMLFFVTFSLTFWAMGTYLFASSRRNPAPVPRYHAVFASLGPLKERMGQRIISFFKKDESDVTYCAHPRWTSYSRCPFIQGFHSFLSLLPSSSSVSSPPPQEDKEKEPEEVSLISQHPFVAPEEEGCWGKVKKGANVLWTMTKEVWGRIFYESYYLNPKYGAPGAANFKRLLVVLGFACLVHYTFVDWMALSYVGVAEQLQKLFGIIHVRIFWPTGSQGTTSVGLYTYINLKTIGFTMQVLMCTLYLMGMIFVGLIGHIAGLRPLSVACIVFIGLAAIIDDLTDMIVVSQSYTNLTPPIFKCAPIFDRDYNLLMDNFEAEVASLMAYAIFLPKALSVIPSFLRVSGLALSNVPGFNYDTYFFSLFTTLAAIPVFSIPSFMVLQHSVNYSRSLTLLILVWLLPVICTGLYPMQLGSYYFGLIRYCVTIGCYATVLFFILVDIPGGLSYAKSSRWSLILDVVYEISVLGILLADALEFCLRGSVEVYLDNPTEKPIYVPPEEEESEEEDELLMEGAESYEEEEWGIRQSLMRGFQ